MNDRRILYLSYNGLLSHLGQSQILPYLSALSQKGYQFFVISFEKKEEKTEDARRINTDFLHWYRVSRGKGPRLFLFIKNLIIGTSLALYLMLRHEIRLIHARSYVPGAMAVALKRLVPRAKVIFDMRGFMLDEYIEVGILRSWGPWVRLGRFFEKQIFRGADTIITLTHKSVPALKQPDRMGKREIPIVVIPCCKVIDRNEIRKDNHRAHGESREIRLIYAGSLGGWYDFQRMLSFFESFHQKHPSSVLEILSPHVGLVREPVEKNYLRQKIRLMTAPFAEVHQHLAKADIGLLFYRPGFSRIGTSPIKFPEYLWAGLPVVATPGVGDLDDLIKKYRVGVILDSTNEEAIEEIAALLKDPQLTERCRWVAKGFYNAEEGVNRYDSVYQRIKTLPC